MQHQLFRIQQRPDSRRAQRQRFHIAATRAIISVLRAGHPTVELRRGTGGRGLPDIVLPIRLYLQKSGWLLMANY
jgi:hypothetical protein